MPVPFVPSIITLVDRGEWINPRCRIIFSRTRQKTMQPSKTIVFIAIIFGFFVPNAALRQSFRRGGTEFNALRVVVFGSDKSYSAMVTEFYHHGQMNPEGSNVAVAVRKSIGSFKILQLGPGDFCRLAFQPIHGESQYDVLYGGDPLTERPPSWTCREGLLLETRAFKNCNPHDLDSVRKAFESSTPIGSDYVDGVFQGRNPFSLKREPFLSHYTGNLDVPSSGKYIFWTSSQDASFLLIDDKLIASAPGRHGPMSRCAAGRRSRNTAFGRTAQVRLLSCRRRRRGRDGRVVAGRFLGRTKPARRRSRRIIFTPTTSVICRRRS